MSTRRFRARLDRLERMAKPVVGRDDLRVDPVLARALRDEMARADELARNRCRYPKNVHAEETSKLKSRIFEMAKAISCPEGYGEMQARKDSHRLEALNNKRRSARGVLSDAEDAEEAQLTALLAAYRQRPQEPGADRLLQLKLKEIYGGLSAAEQSEYDHLIVLFPDIPMDPDDPMAEMYEVLCEKIRQLEEEASRHGQQPPWDNETDDCEP
jgi:hypothetical protein